MMYHIDFLRGIRKRRGGGSVAAAILLGAGSAVLSITFFIAGAPIAAVFELVVCAGLITVLFISTIGLTHEGGED